MSRADLEDLTALCAAGAAGADERAALAGALAVDPTALDLMWELQACAAQLVDVLPGREPPAALRGRLLERVSGRGVVVSLADRRRRRAGNVALVAAVAAAAAFAGLWLRERDSAAMLRTQVVEREDLELVRAPQVELATLGDADATVNVFIDPAARRWLVLAHALPAIGADQDYQLWFVPAEGAPVSAGLLRSAADGIHERAVALPPGLEAAAAALSVERRGGSVTPTDVRMIGQLDAARQR